MKACLLLAVAAVLFSGDHARADSPGSLAYTFAAVQSGGRTVALDVHLRFRLGPDGRATLVVPSAWAGVTDLDKNIEHLAVLTPGATMSPDGHVPFVDVAGAPNADVEIAYQVAANWSGTLARPNYFKPIFGDDHFFIAGAGLFVYPALEGRVDDISIAWAGDVPPVYGDCLGLRVRSAHALLGEGDLQNCTAYGGAYREATFSIHGAPVSVLMAGKWTFDDATFASHVQRIIAMERAFWRDYAFGQFTVVLLPTQDGPGNYGGTAYTNLFAMYVPESNPLNSGFDYLLTHEYFHTWNPRRLFALAQPEGEEYWFSEGFTDYYAYEFLRRSGIITPHEYAETINRKLHDYWLSANARLTNAEIAKRYFEAGVTPLDYTRGAVLAMRWNDAMRTRSGGTRGLDDAMRAIAGSRRGDPADTLAIARRFAPWVGGMAASDVRRYVEGGAMPQPPADLFGRCARLQVETMYAFDAGFDFRKSGRAGTLVGVVDGGPAYRAGLRNGQTFTRKGIYSDASFPVEVTVTQNGGARTITYYPRGAAFAVPQYAVGMPVAGFDACVRAADRAMRLL